MVFFSCVSVATRTERLKAAEAKLLSLARTMGGDDEGMMKASEDCTLTLFDTPISSSNLPFKSDKQKGRENDLNIHGVKAVSSLRSSGGSSPSSSTSSSSSSPPSPLVVLHGYMNGSMYFYHSLVRLSRIFPAIYSLDLLGWGLSSRPKFDLRDSSVRTAEDFFVESLEEWRDRNGIGRMTLAGHSFGGYLSVAYAERYPERVDRLVLISPVGVIDEATLEADVLKRRNERRRTWSRWALEGLFDQGVTPCGALRAVPLSWGRSQVAKFVDYRIPPLTSDECKDERNALTDYLYYNCSLPGSGEYALNRILNAFAYAKDPLVHRIPKLRVPSVTFLYGDRDWMEAEGGLQVQQISESNNRDTQRRQQKQQQRSPHVQVYEIPQAGHLLMLDNWRGFEAGVQLAVGLQPSPFRSSALSPVKVLPNKGDDTRPPSKSYRLS